MLNHSLNKSAMFFGAGVVMRTCDTKRIRGIHHLLRQLPTLGVLWLGGAVAITGAPPFALFLSELTIIRAGLSTSKYFLIGLMAVLLVIIFVGFLNHFRTMYFENGEAEEQTPSRVSPWCLAPMWLALAPLLIMGVWWPPVLWDHFQTIALALQPTHLAEAAR